MGRSRPNKPRLRLKKNPIAGVILCHHCGDSPHSFTNRYHPALRWLK
jgi:hypothetical protein